MIGSPRPMEPMGPHRPRALKYTPMGGSSRPIGLGPWNIPPWGVPEANRPRPIGQGPSAKAHGAHGAPYGPNGAPRKKKKEKTRVKIKKWKNLEFYRVRLFEFWPFIGLTPSKYVFFHAHFESGIHSSPKSIQDPFIPKILFYIFIFILLFSQTIFVDVFLTKPLIIYSIYIYIHRTTP